MTAIAVPDAFDPLLGPDPDKRVFTLGDLTTGKSSGLVQGDLDGTGLDRSNPGHFLDFLREVNDYFCDPYCKLAVESITRIQRILLKDR
jgi:hypothetical protein